MEIKIREISASETWALRQRVMWPDQPISFVQLPNDDKGIHFGLFTGSTLKSVISLFIDEENAQFRKFATSLNDQGKGYGSRLLEHLLCFAQEQDIKKVWCNARIDKTGLYQKFGMKQTNERFEKAGQEYVIMERWF